ncbi:MAG: hypothetical protein R8J94_21495 [Acidimicrobiia bacterium]|nr:hypothetical protein [Acidimicrobiia bacterium]
MLNNRWNWLGAFGFVVLLLAGCAGSDATAAAGAGDDVVVDDGSSTDQSAVETTAVPIVEPTDAATTEATVEEDDVAVVLRDPLEPIAADAAFDAAANPMLEWFEPFEAGTYRTGALGTSVSFTTTEVLNTQVNGGGMFVISDVASRAPDDRDLVFIRVAAFSDPASPNTSVLEQTPWPNDDFLGWLENLHDGVIATEPVETTVNGLAAIRVDLELSDEIECGFFPGSCVGLLYNLQDLKALNKGASYRVWIIEQGAEDPLAIVDGIARDEDAPWYERSDAIMDTLAFGEIAPNPVQPLTSGPNQLAALGGIEVGLPDNVAELTNGRARLINQWSGRGFHRLQVTDEPGAVYFADRPHDNDGNPLTSSDDVVTELAAAGIELTELETSTVGGVETRVFDVASTDVGAIPIRFSPLDAAVDYLGWDTPAAGRMWLIEHPDRGLMMISTHAFENVDVMLPVVNELGEAIVGSLTFLDS